MPQTHIVKKFPRTFLISGIFKDYFCIAFLLTLVIDRTSTPAVQ